MKISSLVQVFQVFQDDPDLPITDGPNPTDRYKGCRMPSRSAIGVCVALLSVLVCLAALMPPAHAQDRSHELSWGPVVDGLRVSITRTPSSATATTAQFRVAIENAGERDAVLNMGLMMANGQVLLPTALFLTITDSQKVGRELSFFSDRRSGRLSGKWMITLCRSDRALRTQWLST